jgi:hypothetical protein
MAKCNFGRFDLQFDGQYQKHEEAITGRVLIRAADVPPPPPPPPDAPPPMLLVTLAKAEALQIGGAGGGVSPYAELVFGSQSKNSSLQDDSTNPVWNEEFRFNITEKLSILEVVLHGCELGSNYGNTVVYGSVEIPTTDLTFGKAYESWYENELATV